MEGIGLDRARAALEKSAEDISALLAPKRGIAFVGTATMTEALRFQLARFEGVPCCLVNPNGGMAEDVPVYRSMRETPDEVDLAVIRVNADRVGSIIEDCAARGIRHAVVFSDSFAEIGGEGARLQEELAQVLARTGVRMLGPNTTDNAFETLALPENPRGRRIALLTQSGALGRAIVEGVDMGACFERWVSLGNEVDLEVADFIHYFVDVDAVGVIACYVEGFKDLAKLRVALERALGAGKPVVAIKLGATERAARFAAGHTGHDAGSEQEVAAILEAYGVVRVNDLDVLLETANLFAKLPVGHGTRSAVFTMSGGVAGLIAEIFSQRGVPLPLFDEAMQARLHSLIAPNLNVCNPIDNGGGFILKSTTETRQAAFDVIAGCPDVDLLVVGFNAAYGPVSDRTAADILAWAPAGPLPIVAIWSSVKRDSAGYRDLVRSGAPIFSSITNCANALAAFSRYTQARARFLAADPAGQP